MKKTILGTVVSTIQKNTVIVKVVRKITHPLYKKLLTVSKKYQVDSSNITPMVGDTVKIIETKPISKAKHFQIKEIIKE